MRRAVCPDTFLTLNPIQIQSLGDEAISQIVAFGQEHGNDLRSRHMKLVEGQHLDTRHSEIDAVSVRTDIHLQLPSSDGLPASVDDDE